MTKITVDGSTQAKLQGVREIAEVCDNTGQVLGHFLPALSPSQRARMEPKISEEELARREGEGGRSLAEIMADLEKRV